MTYQVQVGEDGRTVVLPPEIVQSLGLRPGSSLAAEIDGMSLRFTSIARKSSLTPESASLARLREAMSGYTLDQFLREREREAEG